jgi:hypothetical protein
MRHPGRQANAWAAVKAIKKNTAALRVSPSLPKQRRPRSNGRNGRYECRLHSPDRHCALQLPKPMRDCATHRRSHGTQKKQPAFYLGEKTYISKHLGNIILKH